MPLFSLRPAVEYPIDEIAALLTRGFERYFVPIHITNVVLLSMIRRDSVDLSESRVLLMDDQPVGVALLARRGRSSRLAAMGIVPSARGVGLGKFAMSRLIEEARSRGEMEMFLEVITKNEAAVKLYQHAGFVVTRHLLGYDASNVIGSDDALEECDVRELGKLISMYGLQDLPWQLSGATIANHVLPSRAFRLGDAYAMVSDTNLERVAIFSLLVLPQARGKGSGVRMIRALASRFEEKIWHVPALCPEEMGFVFEKSNFKKEEISQFQMMLTLT